MQPVGEPLPIIPAGPESLFQVPRVEVDGEWLRSSMPTGPRLAGPDGRTVGGSLGVLIDNVLGYALIAHRPRDQWSVSTEIALDLLGPLPVDGSTLHAEARVEYVGGGGGVGFASGRVVDDSGRSVAMCRQWGRFVPATTALEVGAAPFESADGDDLCSLLGARSVSPSGLSLDVAGALQNPMHNLHGGIALCASDLAAVLALADDGPRLATTSVKILYARPVPGASRLDLRTTVRHRGRSLATVDVVGAVGGRVCTLTTVTAQAV